MKIFKSVLTYLMAAFMIYGGVNHFLKPAMYVPFIPDFLPTDFINYGSGLLEIILGIGLVIPKFRYQAALGVLILMLVFLPLHVMDVFADTPAIGSHDAAIVRLPVQFLFILWAWFISRKAVA
ncbi:DoxX family protein [Arcticibacterium luteifluviistationis]|uniref:Methylamine utilisation protein MauE domain-containing protein n=1 Tax=Arcticibacterium luteifluviistationis TaxID=1784714 RepID=A0A2Z4GGR1_9BACT|nr:MauE/DoxX family redox-associated membrane protein [Arcticibacterium luteifluviistationis]AWW00119.1 hypothetical protein DJ013_18875 [Arcticibacterium luteifluviistationis]